MERHGRKCKDMQGTTGQLAPWGLKWWDILCANDDFYVGWHLPGKTSVWVGGGRGEVHPSTETKGVDQTKSYGDACGTTKFNKKQKWHMKQTTPKSQIRSPLFWTETQLPPMRKHKNGHWQKHPTTVENSENILIQGYPLRDKSTITSYAQTKKKGGKNSPRSVQVQIWRQA